MLPNFSTYFVEASFVHRTTSWLNLGLGYREQWDKKGDEWLEESRPFGNATLKWTMWNISFSDRNQMEWRILEDRSDQIRYRNKLMAESPSRWTTWGIYPYVADEIFRDEESGEFLRNRLYLGLKGRPASRLAGDLFAIWESDDTGVNNRSSVYIAGLKLVTSF